MNNVFYNSTLCILQEGMWNVPTLTLLPRADKSE